MALGLVLSTGMRLALFLVRLLLLLLCHNVLKHRPEAFDLAELVADLFVPDMLVDVSCVKMETPAERGIHATCESRESQRRCDG